MDASLSLRAIIGGAALAVAAGCWAQAVPAVGAAARPGGPDAGRAPGAGEAPASPTPEPAVQHIVVEDDGVRIEELRVRGETRRITVHPKGPGPKKGYEIVTPSGGRDMTPNFSPGRGAAGQRVWSVLSF